MDVCKIADVYIATHCKETYIRKLTYNINISILEVPECQNPANIAGTFASMEIAAASNPCLEVCLESHVNLGDYNQHYGLEQCKGTVQDSRA